VSAPPSRDDAAGYRLPRTVAPSRYDLTIRPDLEAATFAGVEDVLVDVHAPVSEIVLNAIDLEIGPSWVQLEHGGRVDVTQARLEAESERLTLQLATTIDPGRHALHVEFEGKLSEQMRGLYRSTYEDQGVTHTIATTHFEPADARRAFPCWDEPDRKAVFGITLVVEEGLAALSNAPEIAREPIEDGVVAVRFADTMPMSTYLVAVVAGRLELTDPVDVDGVPLRVACVPGKTHLAGYSLEVGAFALRFFTRYYGISYPDAKVDFVALPDFAQGAMENLGCITYRENLLLIDPRNATQSELHSVVDVVAHELAHMWFGDLVTMRWWNGLWLNEAFATFMANLVVDAFRPDWDVWGSFRRTCSGAFEVDALHSTRPIEFPVRSPDEASGMFDVLTYTKGAAVLRMLEQWLGEERFRDGIRRYLHDHEHGNTETSDLWDAIEAATEEPVRRIMDTWIWQGGYPLVRVNAEPDGLRLAQERFRLEGGDDGSRWDVPLLVRQEGSAPTTSAVLIEGDEARLDLASTDALAVANAGQSSFVRVAYPDTMLAHLAGDARGRLSPIERFGLVDDAWANVQAGHLTASAYLRFVHGFADETDLHVWQAIITGLTWLERFVEGDTRIRLQALVRGLLRPALSRLGWEPRDGELDLDRSLRGALVAALAVVGADEDVAEQASGVEWRSRMEGGVDASLAAGAIAAIAPGADEQTYEAFLRRRLDAPTPQEQLRYLFALADFRDPTLLERALELAYSGDIRPQNAPIVIMRAVANRANGARAWEVVKERWDEANRRFAPTTIIYLADGVRYLTTPELQADAEAFFARHPIPQAGRMLEQTLERQRINVALRARASADLERSFADDA
jgi:puromycin-sensitive aminopeptidase